MKTLKIVIKGEWFDEIQSGKKRTEYRQVKPFWTSRLYNKEGKKIKYDKIEFINGYNKDARRMVTEFAGLIKSDGYYHIKIGKRMK